MEASEGRETERMAKSAVQTAAETLTYFLRQKDFYLSHVDVWVMSLRNKLKALLKDVDGMCGYNESVQLIEVANNIKNVIDSFIFKIAQQRGETSAGLMSYQSTFNSGIKDKPAIEDLGKKIFDLKTRLDEIILSNRSQYGIHNIQPPGEASTSSNQSQIQREKRTPIVEETEVVGFEGETRTLVGRLIAGDMRRVVISITGRAGTGKTTLAKKVYNDVHVRNRFHIRCWVNVAQEYYQVRDILLASFPWLSRDKPEEDLWRYLGRQRYLVVIDDIWSREAWDGLVTGFPDWENGSRVLLMTRNEEVAKYADTHSTPHKLRFDLNENESWTLFSKEIVEEAKVVSFEKETRTLVGRLIAGDRQRVVISITGMGGTGKSTLARKVYDDIHVRNRFHIRCWVNVAQEYRVRDILLASFPWLSRDKPEEDLRRYLGRKRYLVVIDDIRSREAWDGLVTAFPDWENSSRVLLTTRNEEVAKYADTQSTPHKLRFLNENESWTLFCKKALLGNPSSACLPNLEELGRRMVAKCGGLPLAITVLGGVLSRKEKSMYEWEKVLRSVEWWLHQSEEDVISGILALSYDDLPYYLKPCFLYFGAFPEYSRISVCKLIRIWIAEGFVQRRGEEEMEDVAEDYVEELISRSMIQVSERKSNGMVKKCRINNNLRDLAISKAENERFLYVYGDNVPTSSIMAARLAITSGDISNCISLNSSTPHLLSLLDFSYESGLPEKLALKIQSGAFKFLRVMNLQSEEVNYLPDEIGDLIHLRYLLLEMERLEYLPSTITRLSNLQTLDIRHSFRIEWLPDDIVKMEQIRHLMVPRGRFSDGTQLHHLSNLQTLNGVKAGSWIEDGLEKLTNLRDLEIIEIRGDVHMALSHSISKLVHLRSLSLRARAYYESWIPAFESFSKHEHLYIMLLIGRLEKFPEPHVFPPNLAELWLDSSKLDRDPMVTLEKLPNLRSLYFEGKFEDYPYMGKEMVCSAGGFQLLDTLSIEGFVELEEWRVEEGAMQNLRCLEISYCKRLKMLPDGLRYIITLQRLKLEHMSEELKERVRKNEGEDWFKIRHIPFLIIT